MAKTKTQKRRRVSKASRRRTVPKTAPVPKTRKLKKKGGGNDLIWNWIRLQMQKKTVGAPCFFCGDKDKDKKGWFGLRERWAWPWNNKPKPTTLTNGDNSNTVR